MAPWMAASLGRSDLAALHFKRFLYHVDAGQVQRADRVDPALAMHARKEGLEIKPMLERPAAPHALGRGDGVEQRAVHIEEEGVVEAVEKPVGGMMQGLDPLVERKMRLPYRL